MSLEYDNLCSSLLDLTNKLNLQNVWKVFLYQFLGNNKILLKSLSKIFYINLYNQFYFLQEELLEMREEDFQFFFFQILNLEQSRFHILLLVLYLHVYIPYKNLLFHTCWQYLLKR